MGVATRFAVEYPRRCLDLVEVMEDHARRHRLVGSFALLAAAAVLIVPFERTKAKHVLLRDHDHGLQRALKELKRTTFADAPFVSRGEIKQWRMSRTVANFNDVDAWVDEDGKHPLSPDARNRIADMPVTEVLRAMRNALAHGNIVHLDAEGREQEGAKLHFLALLSRYEDDPKAEVETYRVIVTTEEAFLAFVKAWARWISRFAQDDRDVVALEGAPHDP